MNSLGGWGTCSQALGGPETPGAADWQVFLVQGGFYGGCWVPGFKLSPLGTICSTHAVSCLWVADLAWPTVSGRGAPGTHLCLDSGPPALHISLSLAPASSTSDPLPG